MSQIETVQKEIALDLKIHVCVLWSQQNFAHVTIPVLSWHMQNLIWPFLYFKYFSETLPNHGCHGCPCGHLIEGENLKVPVVVYVVGGGGGGGGGSGMTLSKCCFNT